MKKALVKGVILALLLCFLPSAVFAAEQLIILHTNDLHGQSLAPLATLVEAERAKHPFVLLVDSGDLFSGTAISYVFKGAAEEEAVAALGYDALAIGNHEFDFGLQVLEESIAKGIPWLAANIYKGNETLAAPFSIKEVAGVRVLLVGLTTPATPRMAFPDHVAGLYFADPVQTLKNILTDQAGNYDICLVLSHLGYGDDLILAQKVPGITAIIGGHSHTVLTSPVRIKDTLITQTGSSAQYLGKITIELKEGYPARGELLRIETDTPHHPVIAAIDEHYQKLLAVEMGQLLGYATRDYVKSGMGLLLVEALRHYSGADAALYNGGGVRAGLSRGAVTRADVFEVEPFGNQAVIVTLSGKELAELIQLRSSRSGDFYSGPRVVDLERKYTVATSDFLTTETSSYPMLAKGEITYSGKLVREVLEQYLMEEFLSQEQPAS